eukprot:TRINITY_DN76353_c0_g1_i1.p1 TRINITY_DN76353_c0_g1~~TRINITY_DN76353_c0_g1_i1.p1  ORF type:complete len:706 (+),score=149.23 TRINITY_DN76353_c0_g1_i1:111-2228(+)
MAEVNPGMSAHAVALDDTSPARKTSCWCVQDAQRTLVDFTAPTISTSSLGPPPRCQSSPMAITSMPSISPLASSAGRLGLPDDLSTAEKIKEATLTDVPTAEALAAYLADHGLDTTARCWGEGNTKDVSKYWKELKLDEAGLEIWQKTDGSLQPVRVVHVLRAKVCSPQSYEKGIFLFNTWQQFGNGNIRTRNGLLSEKLSMSELPLEDHLEAVCTRAVTEEEMQRVAEANLRVGCGARVPAYDPEYVCPLKVVDQRFVDRTIEIEESKSYPGLLTKYCLYTVDIVCTGLPPTDFTTLEFDGADDQGRRKLKYIHAWHWLGWSQIQRYLFDGSELKEKKKKDCFATPDDLRGWLRQFDLDLEEWGKGSNKSVEDLYAELQSDKAGLELWGRQDGVPLLMRVVHVLSIKVASSEPKLVGKQLYQMWQQSRDGGVRSVNRLLSQQLVASDLGSDQAPDRLAAHFEQAAQRAVSSRLSRIADIHYELDPNNLPDQDAFPANEVRLQSCQFLDHRYDIEDSQSFRGLHTMYHLYTVEVTCTGLPKADFRSFDPRGPAISGWHWATAEEMMDILHAKGQALQSKRTIISKGLDNAVKSAEGLASLQADLAQVGNADAVEKLRLAVDAHVALLAELRQSHGSDTATTAGKEQDSNFESLASSLPPAMVSKMSENKLVSRAFLDESKMQRSTLPELSMLRTRSAGLSNPQGP